MMTSRNTFQEARMSRYQFTTREGFIVWTCEARTAPEAAEIARNATGRSGLLCTHLSDVRIGA